MIACRSRSSALQTVSRWSLDRSLKPGDWVMKGGMTHRAYWQTGVWQAGWGLDCRMPLPYGRGCEFRVPKSMLRLPPGWQVIKALCGERIYVGPEIH